MRTEHYVWGCIRINGEEVKHKNDLSPTVVFQLTVTRLFLCCSSSLQYLCLDGFIGNICFIIVFPHLSIF